MTTFVNQGLRLEDAITRRILLTEEGGGSPGALSGNVYTCPSGKVAQIFLIGAGSNSVGAGDLTIFKRVTAVSGSSISTYDTPSIVLTNNNENTDIIPGREFMWLNQTDSLRFDLAGNLGAADEVYLNFLILQYMPSATTISDTFDS